MTFQTEPRDEKERVADTWTCRWFSLSRGSLRCGQRRDEEGQDRARWWGAAKGRPRSSGFEGDIFCLLLTTPGPLSTAALPAPSWETCLRALLPRAPGLSGFRPGWGNRESWQEGEGGE